MEPSHSNRGGIRRRPERLRYWYTSQEGDAGHMVASDEMCCNVGRAPG